MRLREISLAVESADRAAEFFASLLNAHPSDIIEVGQAPIQARFVSLNCGPVSVAVMESTAAGSPIDRFLERRGPGLFSLTFEVEDIIAVMSEFSAAGVEFVLPEPLTLHNYSTGHSTYSECLVNFTRPKTSGGVVIELQELRT